MELLREAYKTTSVQQQTSVPEQQTGAAWGGVLEWGACTDPTAVRAAVDQYLFFQQKL